MVHAVRPVGADRWQRIATGKIDLDRHGPLPIRSIVIGWAVAHESPSNGEGTYTMWLGGDSIAERPLKSRCKNL